MKKIAKKRNLRSETVQAYAACTCACYCNCGVSTAAYATILNGQTATTTGTVSMLW